MQRIEATRERLPERAAVTAVGALERDVEHAKRRSGHACTILGPLAEPSARPEREAKQQPHRLLELAPLNWATTEDPTAQGAAGDVIWSADQQEGYMRFRGLAANDPTKFQYQLWIFDSARNTDYPVDGGVFDIPVGADEVIVPITARLPVSDAVLFAITVEAPGGVVVSSRERIALTAQPQG